MCPFRWYQIASTVVLHIILQNCDGEIMRKFVKTFLNQKGTGDQYTRTLTHCVFVVFEKIISKSFSTYFYPRFFSAIHCGQT